MKTMDSSPLKVENYHPNTVFNTKYNSEELELQLKGAFSSHCHELVFLETKTLVDL